MFLELQEIFNRRAARQKRISAFLENAQSPKYAVARHVIVTTNQPRDIRTWGADDLPEETK
jgi:hypothetical protein